MSATFSANNGASALELQQKHNWKNPAMALEYINNSEPHREKMASRIQKIERREPTATITSNELKESPTIETKESSVETEPPAKCSKTGSEENKEKSVLSQISAAESKSGGPVFQFSNCNVTINNK